MLPDKFGRPVDLIQISASGRCQYSCSHCAVVKADTGVNLLPTDQILRFVRILAALGLTRARLIGGGEPLMRQDIVELTAGLVATRGIKTVSMSTNGKLLSEKSEGLKKAGLHHLFVTIPALDRELFKSITGSDGLDATLDGLKAALSHNILTTIRMTLLPGVNDDEMEKLMDFAIERGLDIYIIEGNPPGAVGRIGSQDIIVRISARHKLSRLEGASPFNHPWRLEGTNSAVKIVTADNARACGSCNRLWLSADGTVISCNMLTSNADLQYILEDDPTDEELARYAAKIALNKPMRGAIPCFRNMPTGEPQV
ncbi:MAG: radical SAM protein [Nitrospinae bacterium]|nr:radical SAM protein [Nitrospinota bacterium]